MIIRLLAALAVALVVAVPSFAQDNKHGDKKEQEVFRQLLEDEAKAWSLDETKDRDIRKLIETLMMVRLSEALELSAEETVVMVRLIGEYKDKILQLKWERGDLMHTLRNAVEDEDVSEEFVQSKLDALLEVDSSINQSLHSMIDKASETLTVGQTAKLYLFVGDFEREMHALVERAKRLTRERMMSEHEDENREEQESNTHTAQEQQ